MDKTIQAYDLEGMTVELQKLLRVQDWDISTELLDNNCFYRSHDSDNIQGDCTRDRWRRQALVRINIDHQGTQEPLMSMNQGWLHTLIHEVLHVFVDDFTSIAETAINDDSDMSKYYQSQLTIQQESLINRMTRLVLSLMDVEAFLARHRKVDQHEATEATE